MIALNIYVCAGCTTRTGNRATSKILFPLSDKSHTLIISARNMKCKLNVAYNMCLLCSVFYCQFSIFCAFNLATELAKKVEFVFSSITFQGIPLPNSKSPSRDCKHGDKSDLM